MSVASECREKKRNSSFLRIKKNRVGNEQRGGKKGMNELDMYELDKWRGVK